ncbi:MAG: ABC transporter permease [Erysipelotrichales bacterium]|nr:ABC transporter permease [Erysipelotrichales bacterium]MBQ2309709.1 ABC transporter permease [Erysipelotrichales bacterium]MBQ2478599.1 ABC transporter permease [Erysipelotrichales bacterium]MBQ5542027.1 ABC transporter permease [Erysipelotrichales bacterium]
MRKYVIKRLLLSVLILVLVTLLIYGLMRALPTSYIEAIARQKSQQPGSRSYEEWMELLTASYGFDKGILAGYLSWAKEALKLNFGDSWFYTVPVTEKFNSVIWTSFTMSAISMFFEIAIAIPLGIIAATHQYQRADNIISVIAIAGISLPTFFFASLLKLVFSVKLGWFDLYGMIGRNYEQLDAFGKFLDKAHHMVLPIVTLVVISIGGLMRYTRTNMLEVMNADYIRTARAKGVSEKKVIYHHAFRNTLIPLVTIIGGSLPGLFSGAQITETLYGIQGIGLTSFNAMVAGDIPFSMFYLTFMAVLTLLGNLIADILYAVVDPRVRIA